MDRTLQLLVAVTCTALAGMAAAENVAASYNEQGVESFEQGDIDSAIFYFSEAIRHDPNSDVIRSNLSNAYQTRAGEYAGADAFDDAIDDLERALRIEPSNPRPLIHLGSIHLKLNEIESAIFRLEEAIELDPGNVDAHFLLGEAYYRDNDAVAALDQWEWVHTVQPRTPGLRERLRTVKREAKVEGEFEWKSSRHFAVTYHPDLSYSSVKSVLRILEDAYDEIGRGLDRTYPPGPIQVTLYSPEGFAESTQMGAHIAGIYDGNRIRCPVLRDDGALVEYDTLKSVLYHEYTHAAIRHIAPRNVPWWLNEGLAETLSGPMSREERTNLRYLADNEMFFPLDTLVTDQLEALNPEDLQIAYLQAHATVRYLYESYGDHSVVDMIEDLNDGMSHEKALRRNFRRDYGSLERAAVEWIAD